MTLIFLAAGVLAMLLALRLRTRYRLLNRVVVASGSLLTVLLLFSAGYHFWYCHRPIPESVEEVLFPGVTYTRDVRSSPRPVVIHVVTVDLESSGARFLVTPSSPREGRQLGARRTSQFLEEFGVQIAINGGFFHPWYSKGPWSYYPHEGDPVDPVGFTMSRGEPYMELKPRFTPLYLSDQGRVSLGRPLADCQNAITGKPLLVEEGRVSKAVKGRPSPEPPNPRTAVATDRTGRRLMLIVVDGRQPNYSEGVTMRELARIAIQ
jgi:hypothetical protein